MHFGSHIPMDTMDSIPVYLPDNTLCPTDTSDWYRYSGQNNPRDTIEFDAGRSGHMHSLKN